MTSILAAGEATKARLESRPDVQKVPTPKLDLFRMRAFASDEECAALIDMIERRRRPSTLSDDTSGDAAFRTSETCDMDEADPVVARINLRFCEILGIDAALGEPLQGQRYLVGQEFKAHTDYFDPRGMDLKSTRSVMGQRTWTAMVYLNTPEAGGATRFKAIGKTIQPVAGMMLAWNNRRADGSVNPSTLHHAMKIRAGRKYVLTKWFCERPWPSGRG